MWTRGMRGLRDAYGLLAIPIAVGCSSNGSSGSAGPAGPKGDPGAPGASVTPSLAGIFPRTLPLDRELDVVILGNATTFTGMEMVDLGSGVGVFNLTAASPTVLTAHLKIDKAAAVGPRDLHVGMLAQTQAAVVAPDIDVSVLSGTPAQASLAILDIINRDVDNALELNFALAPDPALDLGPLYLTSTEARDVVLFDPLAPSGPAQLTGENIYIGPDGPVVVTSYLSAPSVVMPAARTPTALMVGAAATMGTIGQELGSDYYHLTTDGTAQILAVAVVPVGGMLFPRVELYGSGGLGADRITDILSFASVAAAFDVPFANMAADLYAVVMDQTLRGGAGFSYNMGATKLSAALVAEQSSAHGTQSTAQSIGSATRPFVVSGTLSAGLEQDWYQIPLAALTNCPRLSFTTKAQRVTVHLFDSSGADTGASLAPDPRRPQSGFNSSVCGTLGTTPWYLVVQSNSASAMGAYAVGVQ